MCGRFTLFEADKILSGTDPRPDAGDPSSDGVRTVARSGATEHGFAGPASRSVPTGGHARIARKSPGQCPHRRRREVHSLSFIVTRQRRSRFTFSLPSWVVCKLLLTMHHLRFRVQYSPISLE